jgi:hypothetical protein
MKYVGGCTKSNSSRLATAFLAEVAAYILSFGLIQTSANAQGVAERPVKAPNQSSPSEKSPSVKQPEAAAPEKTPNEKQPEATAPEKTPNEKQPEATAPEKTPNEKQPEAAAPEKTPSETQPEAAAPEKTPGEKQPEAAAPEKTPGETQPAASFTGQVSVDTLQPEQVSAEAAPVADENAAVEKMVVTAQFREQNPQDTPLAVTVVNGDMIEQRNQIDISHVADQAPNVNLTPGPNIYGPSLQAFIRGVGQHDFNYALEPGVGIYVDDVYYSTLTGSIIDLLDVDRVEVLRGPQGTLAGQNSIGGAIKLY